jgi:LysR family transcriptional regulator, carnitine catabolism transcriptional activator
MNVTVRQLRAFVAVAQLSGFSAAARRLHLTQSALSMLVRTLEEEIGVALFERTTRSVKLTDAGRDFLPQAERMLTDLHNAVAGTRVHAERGRGRLVIAVTPTFASTLLPGLLAQYREDNPQVMVVLRDDVSPRQIRRLVQEGEADVGIGPLERGERGWFVIDVLMDDELMLACPAGHALARRKSVSWGELADQPLIGFARDNAMQSLVEQSLAATGVRLRPRYEVASIATAAALVAEGLGVSILPSYVQQLGLGQRVEYRPLVDPVVKRDLCLLRLRDRAMPAAAQRFIDVVLARLAEQGTLGPAP